MSNGAPLSFTRKELPFLVLGVFLFIFYASATALFSDDLRFRESFWFDERDFLALIKYYYFNWSSRLLIMPVTIVLCQSNIWLWRILDLSFSLILVFNINYLFNKKSAWLSVALFLLYPFWHMATAGWIATTTGFLWPLSLGVYCFAFFKRLYSGARITWEYALFIPALLYATDAEQAALILFLVFLYLTAREFFKNSDNKIYRTTLFVSLIFSGARVIFHLVTPGNAVRATSLHYTLPNFNEYSLITRLALGFELSALHYLQFTVLLFPFFSLFLFLYIFNSHKETYKKIIAAFPLGLSLVYSIRVAFITLNNAPALIRDYSGNVADAIIMASIPRNFGFWFYIFLYALFFAALFYSLYLTKPKYLCCGIMGLGFFSQLILGLANSMYGSALRTFIYASFAMIICVLIIYNNGGEEIFAKSKFLKISMGLFLFANVLITYSIAFIRAGL